MFKILRILVKISKILLKILKLLVKFLNILIKISRILVEMSKIWVKISNIISTTFESKSHIIRSNFGLNVKYVSQNLGHNKIFVQMLFEI